MMQKEDSRTRKGSGARVAPNMGAGGSHPQATSRSPKWKKRRSEETRVLRWADCNDEEVKENEEEVAKKKMRIQYTRSATCRTDT